MSTWILARVGITRWYAPRTRERMTDQSSHRGSGPSGRSRRDYPDRSVVGGELGIWSRELNSVAAPQAREAAAEVEELGYAALWFGEVLGREAFTNASLLLCA